MPIGSIIIYAINTPSGGMEKMKILMKNDI